MTICRLEDFQARFNPNLDVYTDAELGAFCNDARVMGPNKVTNLAKTTNRTDDASSLKEWPPRRFRGLHSAISRLDKLDDGSMD